MYDNLQGEKAGEGNVAGNAQQVGGLAFLGTFLGNALIEANKKVTNEKAVLIRLKRPVFRAFIKFVTFPAPEQTRRRSRYEKPGRRSEIDEPGNVAR